MPRVQVLQTELVDIIGRERPLHLAIGRESESVFYIETPEFCWVMDNAILSRLNAALYMIICRMTYRRPNTRVKPGCKSFRLGTGDGQVYEISCGIEATEEADLPFFAMGRRIYLSVDQVRMIFNVFPGLKTGDFHNRRATFRPEQ
jgi:hypothetical protein